MPEKNDDPQLEEILPEDALNMMSGMIPLRVNAVCSFPLLDNICTLDGYSVISCVSSIMLQ